jgi:SWIM/SEC-C metal-binding protein
VRICVSANNGPRGGKLAKLGTHKRPAVVRVQTAEKAQLIVDLCNEHGWQVIAGVEEDKFEDTSDVEKLVRSLNDAPKAAVAPKAPPKIGGNDYCPCRSGKKYKKCCGAPGSPA